MTPPTKFNTPSPVPSHPSAPQQTSLTSTPSTVPAGSSCNPSFHSSPAPPRLTKSVDLTNGDNMGVQVRQNLHTALSQQNSQHPNTQHGSNFQRCPEIPTPLKGSFPPPSSPTPQSPSKSPVVSSKVFERIKAILGQCGHGVWASALPKLYMDTYKMPFPEHILDSLSLLDICRVEYPLAHDKTKVS